VRGGPVILTVVISAALHVALATGLVAVAQNREVRRRAISVAVQDAKKKEAAKPKPPPPPKAIVHAPPPKAAPVAPAPTAAPAHVAHAAPVAMNLALGNTGGGGLDVGPGIGLHGRAEPAAGAAPVKVASSVSESRLKKVKEEAGAEAPCEEEPTKPEPVFKTEINYGVYPQAQQDGIEGKIKLRFTVSETGEVSQVDVLEAIDPGLDAAVVAAAKSWRFKPAMACGKPVAGGTYVFAARFELGN
jgi:periplasmic protein TonB